MNITDIYRYTCQLRQQYDDHNWGRLTRRDDIFLGVVRGYLHALANHLYNLTQPPLILPSEISNLKSKIQWIPVTDQLPDDGLTVLLHSPEASDPVYPGFRELGLWRWISGELVFEGVSHWAHFPDPPSPTSPTSPTRPTNS